MNRATIIGNVGRDPEIRTFQDGGKVANLVIATSEKWKDKDTGERKEATEWHRVAVFGPLAGIVEQYVTKGMKLAIEGQLRTRKWQDQSGQDRYSTEIVLQGPRASLEMLGGGQKGGDNYQSGDPPATVSSGRMPAGGGPDMDDEVPFAPEWRI